MPPKGLSRWGIRSDREAIGLLRLLQIPHWPADDGEDGLWEDPLDILIIDDSKYIRAFTRIHLQEAGYAVTEVEPTSLFAVLEAIHTHRPALVITDYEMPLCNGETVLRSIREDAAIRDTPVMIMTSHREAELVARLSQWQLAGYLLKPITPEGLVDTVRRFFCRGTSPEDDGLGPAR